MSKAAIVACMVFGITALSPVANAKTFKTLYSFSGGIDGASPETALLHVGGVLYGMTEGGGQYATSTTGGTMFKIDLATGVESVVHAFGHGKDGNVPWWGALIAAAGNLYGTTSLGGKFGNGTVFKIDPATGAETYLHSFDAADGEFPYAGLIDVGGALFGTTYSGGKHIFFGEGGTVFEIDPATKLEKVIHSFAPSDSDGDGFAPAGGLIRVGASLYGTTEGGGSGNGGTVFKINFTTGAYQILHAFPVATGPIGDGSGPRSGLVAAGGFLYGTTLYGGSSNKGTVFKINPATGKESVVHSFADGHDGAQPWGGLLAVGGFLYGTTVQGGPDEFGTVFQIDLATGKETVLHSFDCTTDGASPIGALINVGDTLYGTTSACGGGGTVFSLTR